MTTQRDIERLLDDWLAEGPTQVSDRVVDQVADRIGHQSQPPAWRLSWKDSPVNRYIKPLAAVAAVAIVAVVGWKVVGYPSGSGIGASPTPTPTELPRPTSTASPAATPSPTGPVVSSIDPVVLLRVEIRGDVSVGRIPALTVYRDGTVLRPDDSSGRITQLTPVGLGLLLAPATDSGLLATSGAIGPDPAYQGGFTSYSIELRRGEEIINRKTTNSLTPATRAEGERIIALAERLVDLESWLPADAWASGPASATPYIASDFLLKITVFKNQPGAEYPPLLLDVADVDWPLAGRLEDFGQALAEPPLGAGSASRCGLVTLEDATSVERALAAAPLVPAVERMEADLDWAEAKSRVSVSLAPLLPDDPRDCTVDGSWP